MKLSSSIRLDSLIIQIFFIFFYDHHSACGSNSGHGRSISGYDRKLRCAYPVSTDGSLCVSDRSYCPGCAHRKSAACASINTEGSPCVSDRSYCPGYAHRKSPAHPVILKERPAYPVCKAWLFIQINYRSSPLDSDPYLNIFFNHKKLLKIAIETRKV